MKKPELLTIEHIESGCSQCFMKDSTTVSVNGNVATVEIHPTNGDNYHRTFTVDLRVWRIY